MWASRPRADSDDDDKGRGKNLKLIEVQIMEATLFVSVMSLLFFALWPVGAIGPELFYW
jgi:hypothetical protein